MIKHKGKVLLITGIIVLLAIGCILAVALINGWDIAGFFKSSMFFAICILLGLYAFFVAVVLISSKLREYR